MCSAAAQAEAPDRIPATIVNNSEFTDEEIYVAIIGQDSSDNYIYYDLATNSSADAGVKALSTDLNTLHKAADDWGYANIFTKLSEIADKKVYIAQTKANRMFISFKSPMYLHVHGSGTAGYAGADFQNSSDPNHDIRWEIVEFTYDQYKVMFVNTTRVDAFQYPMGVELYGGSSANNPYTKRGEIEAYSTIVERWRTDLGSSAFADCLQEVVTADNLGPIIVQPSKVATIKNNGYFDDYISRTWSAFASKSINVKMGVLGRWTGKVDGDNFVLSCVEGDRAGQTAIVGRPTTVDVIEGAGAFASSHGNDADLHVQAMFCGAMNRGVLNTAPADSELQDWGATENYFKTDTYNPYVEFFHRTNLSYEGYTYAFAYDDTFDQSSTCATSDPTSITITVGGFANQTSSGEGGSTEPTEPTTIPAAPVPTQDASNVMSVYSDSYKPATTMAIGQWNSSTVYSTESLSGNEAYKFANFNWIGFELNGNKDVDFSGMETIHIDLYASEDMTVNFYPIWRTDTGYEDKVSTPLALSAGQWNSFDMAVTEFAGLDLARIYQFKLDGGNGQTIYMDNLYMYKTASGGGTTEPTEPTTDPTVYAVLKENVILPVNYNTGTYSSDGNTFNNTKEETEGNIYWKTLTKGGVNETSTNEFMNLHMYYWVEHLTDDRLRFTFTFRDVDHGYTHTGLVPAVHFYDQSTGALKTELSLTYYTDNEPLRCPSTYEPWTGWDTTTPSAAPQRISYNNDATIEAAMTTAGYRTVRVETTEAYPDDNATFSFNMQFANGGLTQSSNASVENISQMTGIKDVNAEPGAVRVTGGRIEAPAGAQIFDMQGRRVMATESPAAGIYIVVYGGKAQKLLVR